MKYILIVWCFIIVACNNNTNSLSKQGKNKTSNALACDIEFDVPNRWSIENKNWPIIICEPKLTNKDDFNECIVIDKLKLDSAQLSPLAIATQLRIDTKFQDEGLIPILFEADTLKDIPSYKYTYHSLLNNATNDRVKVDNYIFVENGFGYIISTRCLLKNKTHFDPIFFKFIQSLQK